MEELQKLILLEEFKKYNIKLDDITVSETQKGIYIEFWHNKKLLQYEKKYSEQSVRNFIDGMLYAFSILDYVELTKGDNIK